MGLRTFIESWMEDPNARREVRNAYLRKTKERADELYVVGGEWVESGWRVGGGG